MLTERFYAVLADALRDGVLLSHPLYLAVGTGGEGREEEGGEPRAVLALSGEVARKQVDPRQVVSLDERGNPTREPSTRIAVTVTFGEGEAMGMLRECGLFGIDATEKAGTGTLLSRLVHAPVEKTNAMVLRRTVRLDLTPRPFALPERDSDPEIDGPIRTGATLIRQPTARYLGNSFSRELHDLANANTNCQTGEIPIDRRYPMETLEEADALGYDRCAFCFGREASRG